MLRSAIDSSPILRGFLRTYAPSPQLESVGIGNFSLEAGYGFQQEVARGETGMPGNRDRADRSKEVEGGRFDRYDLFAFSAVGEVTMEVGSQFSFSDSRTLVLPLANSR
jgi:hypothetical protein